MSYIRRAEDLKAERSEAVQNGPGHVIGTPLINSPEEMLGKGRLFKEEVLEKDCGVGYHVHHGDAEFYLILSGEAEYDDNGTKTTVKAGDFTFTGDGEGHSIVNRKDEPVRFLAVILYY